MNAFNFWAYFVVLVASIMTAVDKIAIPKVSSPQDYKLQFWISFVLLILLVKYK